MQHQKQFQNDLSNAAQVISNQITKLNKLSKKYDTMDADFRKQIVENVKVGNNVRARALANELVNIHRIQRTTRNMGMSLEVLNDVTTATSEILNYNVNSDMKISMPIDEDALKILSEVEQSVEEETKLKLPDIPDAINVIKSRSELEPLLEENE